MTSTVTLPRPSVGHRIWAGSWRLAVATLTGLVLFALVVPTFGDAGWSDARLGATILIDVAAGIVALALVPFRHRAPLVVTLLVVALSAVSTLGAGAAVLVVVSLATRRRATEIALASAVMLAATLFSDWLTRTDDGSPMWQIALVAVIGTALLDAVGIGIGQRRALLASLRERAALLERDQQLLADRAREQERAHLAREMHDVLGHRLSLVTLHAGALEYRGTALTPEETAEAAAIVRAEAHAALTDLRDVLGVLRDPAAAGGDDVTGTAPPQPTLTDLPALLDEARRAGAAVTVTDTVSDPSVVPAAVGRHAYRIVQEALTNARRHAPGQPVAVAVAVRTVLGPALRVVVTNPLGPAAPAATTGLSGGHGLRGLAERARLVGGTFRAGAVDGTHAVEAVLPWTP